MNKYLKELVLWAFIALPYAYLATIWNELPEKVPIHFNMDGVANGWASKSSLLFIPGVLGIGIYLLMAIIPVLDPKKKIQQMEGKYYNLRFLLTIFISLLATYTLYMSKTGSLKNPNMLFGLIGVLFAMLGNYFQTVRPNYFIGIRTPWALENEQVWRRTHRLGGRLWTAGGVLIAILAIIISNQQLFFLIFCSIVFVMVIVPVIFSYSDFKKIRNT